MENEICLPKRLNKLLYTQLPSTPSAESLQYNAEMSTTGTCAVTLGQIADSECYPDSSFDHGS